jgi:Zn ribbon nucleic-acid-binding protein
MELPDCPQCNATSTLMPARVEPRGVKVCSCSSCGTTCRVNADGAVIHESRESPTPAERLDAQA